MAVRSRQNGKGGRPKADLNWDEIDQLLIAGCSGVEVAGYVGVSKETIWDRCEKDKGIMFSQYSKELRSKGQSLLRAQQFAKALGKTDKGDNTLLIWLGKQRLDQREREKDDNKSDPIVVNVISYADKDKPLKIEDEKSRPIEAKTEVIDPPEETPTN